jgi:hypothetical protein
MLGVQIKDGTFIRPGEYATLKSSISKYVGDVSLFQLISRIQAVSTISADMDIVFRPMKMALMKLCFNWNMGIDESAFIPLIVKTV